jgi:hypothetical protein
LFSGFAHLECCCYARSFQYVHFPCFQTSLLKFHKLQRLQVLLLKVLLNVFSLLCCNYYCVQPTRFPPLSAEETITVWLGSTCK